MTYYLVYLALIGVITLLFYGEDKRRAIAHRYRVSERTLLLLSCLGGAAGGLLAMNLFRHKTRHWYFWIVNIVFLLIYGAVAVALWRLGVPW